MAERKPRAGQIFVLHDQRNEVVADHHCADSGPGRNAEGEVELHERIRPATLQCREAVVHHAVGVRDIPQRVRGCGQGPGADDLVLNLRLDAQVDDGVAGIEAVDEIGVAVGHQVFEHAAHIHTDAAMLVPDLQRAEVEADRAHASASLRVGRCVLYRWFARWRSLTAPTSTKMSSSCWAPRCQLNLSACAKPLRTISSRSFSSPSTVRIAVASSSTELASTVSAAAPTASGKEELSLVIVGTPHAIASTGGMPKPSYRLG